MGKAKLTQEQNEEKRHRITNNHLSIEELETAYHALSMAYRELAKENEEIKRENVNLKRLIDKKDDKK